MIAGGLAVGPLYPAVRKWLTGDGSTPPTQTEVHNPSPTLTEPNDWNDSNEQYIGLWKSYDYKMCDFSIQEKHWFLCEC